MTRRHEQTRTRELEMQIRMVDVEITKANLAHYDNTQRLFLERLQASQELVAIAQAGKKNIHSHDSVFDAAIDNKE